MQVLSEQERHQVHEQTLRLLVKTGVRVDTQRGRSILGGAGAQVDEHSGIVRFPMPLIENALQAAPKNFSLGGRRAGWCLPMNAEESTLLVDSQAIYVLDANTGRRRPPAFADWLMGTHLVDMLDDFGVYWCVVELGLAGNPMAHYVSYWRNMFRSFSKHVQESTENPEQTRWLLRVLEVVFGSREAVRQHKPFSFLLCPVSPLGMEGLYTDAYLETLGWEIPVAVMPMPLMGMTSPASLIGTLVLANCEVLATLCLVQAAGPGTPFIYAAVPSVVDPRTGRYGGGGIENALLGAGITEMARYYNLPVESSTGGTDHHVPGIQAGYERALNWVLPVLSWPDILVGPGLLGGSTILSLEQLMIDLEIYRRCKRLSDGIDTGADKWLIDAIEEIGPGGNFLNQRSTRQTMRSGEWYISELGVHTSFEEWEQAGKPTLIEEAREKVYRILASYQPRPLDDAVERELERIERSARSATNSS
jgi:trimethylamine--corrinoid protein Co-methyltransferase